MDININGRVSEIEFNFYTAIYDDKALKIYPNYFEEWANKGFTLENLDKLDEAVECNNKTLEIFTNNPNMLNRLSFIKAQKNCSEILDLYL